MFLAQGNNWCFWWGSYSRPPHYESNIQPTAPGELVLVGIQEKVSVHCVSLTTCRHLDLDFRLSVYLFTQCLHSNSASACQTVIWIGVHCCPQVSHWVGVHCCPQVSHFSKNILYVHFYDLTIYNVKIDAQQCLEQILLKCQPGAWHA